MEEHGVIAHLSDGRTSVVVVGGGGVPAVAYWGAALGDDALPVALFERPVVGGGLDVDAPVGVVAEAAAGWFGLPGIEGSRPDGSDFAPRFALQNVRTASHRLVMSLVDEHAQLHLRITLTLGTGGVIEARARLRNDGDEAYRLDALRLSLPVPGHAGEVLTVGGRHNHEFVRHRTPWVDNAVVVSNRHGKTSHERLGVVVAGTPGFGETRGEVWACHIGWSGNYELTCDASTDGRKVVHAGELLLPGEVRLAPGESHATPPAYFAWSDLGLNGLSAAYHAYLRARPGHPRLPRPVHLNTWEAVYFDHDLDTLTSLADLAAEVGVERFVLDDGWFGGRRDDTRGLGDWWVSDEVWPSGLGPLVDHVRDLGMEFGIWVEPEMVSIDSELYRAHPEWALVDQRYPHVTGRNQLVLDVGRPEVRDHLFEALDSLLSSHDIAYVKWDHNRDLVSPAGADGAAGVRRQTLGAYALLDRLRAAHPGVEIETCASGGGRVDFGILARTDRVWPSDSIDALDRLAIQRGFTLLFPPELMGAHVGAPASHATGRRHRMGLRGASALFGAFGVEWDLLAASRAERDELAQIIALHKRFRSLLHTGVVTRLDHADATVDVHGVVAADRAEALFQVTRLASGASHHTPPLRLCGLDDRRTYRVGLVEVVDAWVGHARRQPSWLADGLVATGRQLATVGVPCPQLEAESSLLLHVTPDTVASVDVQDPRGSAG